MKYFVDANVFIRIITNDDFPKAEKCLDYLKHSIDKKQKLFIATISIAEIIWLLKSFYGLDKKKIYKEIVELQKTRNLYILSSPDKDMTLKAAEMSYKKNIDFIDAYHFLIMKRNKIKNIITYDDDFKKLKDIRVIQP